MGNSEPIPIEPCSGFERASQSHWAGLNQATVHACTGKVKQGRYGGGCNEQCSELGIWTGHGDAHSARPNNRVRGGCHGGDDDRRAGQARRARGLDRRRWRCGVGSVAQIRTAAQSVSVGAGRGLRTGYSCCRPEPEKSHGSVPLTVGMGQWP